MAELNIKNNIANVKAAIDQLDTAAKKLSDNSNAVMLILKAVDKGMLTTTNQIKKGLELASTGIFDKKDIKAFRNQLNLSEKNVEELSRYWEKIRTISKDNLKNSIEFKEIYAENNDIVDTLLSTYTQIGSQQKDNLRIEQKSFDLSSTLVDKLKQFTVNFNKLTPVTKSVNIDLSNSIESLAKMTAESVKLSNLFDPAPFDWGTLEPQINAAKTLIDALEQGKSSIELPDIGELDTGNAVDVISKAHDIAVGMINQESAIRMQKLKTYIAAQMGFQYDLQNQILTNLNTQEKLNKTSANEKIAEIETIAKSMDSLSDKLIIMDSLNATDKSILMQKLNVYDDISKQLLIQNTSAKNIENTHLLQLKTQKSQVDVLKSVSRQMESLRDISYSVQEGIQSMFSALPYSMQNLLGIQNVSAEIGKATNKATEAWLTTIKAGKGQTAATASFLKSFGSSLTAAIGPLGLLLAGVGLIAATLMGFESAVGDMSKELGVSRKKSLELYQNNMDLLTVYGNQTVALEDINAIQKAHLEQYGRLFDVTNKANAQAISFASNMANSFNIPIEDAYSLSSTMQKLGADQTLAENLIANMGYMSEMAGISPNIISKDLLESADELSLYFANQPKQAMKATIEIKRMGMSLKKAGEIATKMLDIEGFMTDMTELAAMTNGGLNLSKAFDLRMNGDIEGMTKSIMSEIGTLQNFNSQSEFVQRKLSNTLGMSVSELKNSVKLNELNNSLSKEQKSLLESNLGSLGDITGMNADALKQKAQELDNQKRLSVAFSKLKGVLITALVPLMETLSRTITDLSPAFDIFIGGVKLASKLLTPLVWVAQGFLIPFKALGTVIGWINDMLETVVNFFSKLTGQSNTLNGTLDITSGLIKGIGAYLGVKYLGKLTGITNLIGKLTQTSTAAVTATESLQGIGKGTSFLAKLKGIMTGEGSLLGKLFGKNIGETTAGSMSDTLTKKKGLIGRIFDKINPFKGPSKEIIANTITTTEKSGNIFSKFWEVLSTGFTKVSGKFADVAKTVLDGTKQLVSSISGTITSVVKNILSSIKSVANTVINTVFDIGKNIIDKIVKLFNTTLPDLGKGIVKITNKIIGGISQGVNTIIEMLSKGVKSLSSSVGKLIENVLTGLSNGLNKFSAKSLIGASTLLIVSGALYVTAKAVQEFINVDWESLGKAGVSLLGLTGVAMLLGNSAPMAIAGAAALLLLSAALIPMAYGLNMFNDISWESLGKAGVALLGLTAAVIGLGAVMLSGVGAAAIISGTIALAAMGVALMPLGISLKMLAGGIDSLATANWDGLSKGIPILMSMSASLLTFSLLSPGLILSSFAVLTLAGGILALSASLITLPSLKTTLNEPLIGLNQVDSSNIIKLSGGLIALSGALAVFSGGNLLTSFVNMLAGNPFKELQVLANMSTPIKTVADSIALLVSSLSELSVIAQALQLEKLSDLKNINIPDIQRNVMAANTINTNTTIPDKLTNKLVDAKQIQTPAKYTIPNSIERPINNNNQLNEINKNFFRRTDISSTGNSLVDNKIIDAKQLYISTDKIIPKDNIQPIVDKRYEMQPLENRPQINVNNQVPVIRPENTQTEILDKPVAPKPQQVKYPDINQDNNRLVFVLTQILTEIRNSNGKPIQVNLSDDTLKSMNKKMKAWNNN